MEHDGEHQAFRHTEKKPIERENPELPNHAGEGRKNSPQNQGRKHHASHAVFSGQYRTWDLEHEIAEKK